MSGRHIVVTGAGAISPLGMTAKELWEGLCTGRRGIDRIKAFDPAGFTCQIAGEAPDFKIQKYLPKSYRKASKLMSRDIMLAIAAANEAIEDSGFVTKATDEENATLEPTRTAINIGAGLISCELVELAHAVETSITDGRFDIRKWGTAGLEALTPIWLLKYLPNMPACHIGIIHDIQGPSNTITCGEAGGTLAIAEAIQVIKRGSADVALAGGCEAKVNPIVMLRQCLLKRATSRGNDNPPAACRPFDSKATGAVFGEAAAVLVLEEKQHAINRGAKIYAQIAGCGSSNSLNTEYEHLEPDGKGLEIAIRQALEDAGIGAKWLDLIVPCGTGIPQDDAVEAAVIQRILGQKTTDVPVWPIKSMVSHTGAGAGAIDAIAVAMAIAAGKTGAAKNFEKAAEGCNLNIAVKPVEKDIRCALCCSYSFGGQTAALVFKKYDGNGISHPVEG